MSSPPIPVASEILVSGPAGSWKVGPSVTGLADGGYTVGWSSMIQQYVPGTFDLDVWDVYARSFAPGGAPLTAEFRVNPDVFYTSQHPALATLANGNVIAAYYSNNKTIGAYSGGEIGAVAFSPDAGAFSGEVRVNSVTAYTQDNPAVAALGASGHVVVWQSGEGLYGPYDIKGQLYGANGAPVGGEFPVNTTTAGDQWKPAVAILPGGGFVVVWEGRGGQDGSGDGIFAQIFEADGTPSGAEFGVNTTTGDNQRAPAVAWLTGGGFVVVWHSYGQDGSDAGVFAQMFTAAGAKVGGEIAVNSTTGGFQGNAAVAATPDGGFVVAWTSVGQDGSDGGIYQQRFDAAGAPVGSETLVNTTTAGHQDGADIAALAGGGYVIAWHGFDIYGSAPQIYAQEFAPQYFGTNAAESLTGTAGADNIDGRGGNDTIAGMAGDDTLLGGDGDDALDGGRDRDKLYGGSGNDTLGGGAHNDSLFGEDGDDRLDGGSGNDRLDGGAGNDLLSDLLGNNKLIGGTGNDTLRAGAGNDTLYGGAQADRIEGGAGNDILRGDGGNDRLFGGDGDDLISGGPGRDLLDGGSGADTLRGGSGNDTMTGGNGADVFEFDRTLAEGTDTIADFQTGLDVIRIEGGSFAELMLVAANGGLATQIVTPWGTTILLEGVAFGTLEAGDFSFL